MKTKTEVRDPVGKKEFYQSLIAFHDLSLLSPSMHAMLVVSFPNSTAIIAAKAQKSALDFPESLTKRFVAN